MGYLDSSSIGQVEQVMDADVERVEALLAHQVPDLASALATLIVLFVLMFTANVWLALACLAPIVIGIALSAAGDGQGHEDGRNQEELRCP